VEIDLFKNILNMAKSTKLAAISGIAGAFLIHLTVGAIYRWNMISGYARTYYQTDYETPAIAMLCAGLTMRLGFLLSNKYGSRVIMSIAIIVSALSTAIASKMPTFPCTIIFT
jgi:hypothetical protein